MVFSRLSNLVRAKWMSSAFDFCGDFVEQESAVRCSVDRLRLNAAEHRRAARSYR